MKKEFARVEVQVFGFGDFADGGSQEGHYDVVDATIFRNLALQSKLNNRGEDTGEIIRG